MGLRVNSGLHDHVPSALIFGPVMTEGPVPAVTVAIPTFNRPDLLIEAVKSVLSQTYGERFDIIIVDNASEEKNRAIVLDWLGRSANGRVRYFLNAENIGLYANWSRCIELTRTRWLTVLNDDDLLDPAFLSTSMRLLLENPRCPGLVCKKRLLDEREGENRPVNRQSRLARLRDAVRDRVIYHRGVRRILPSELFWQNFTGNSVGFIFERVKAVEIGGFHEEEHPSADYGFYVRYAIAYGLWQSAYTLVSIRIGRNESMRPEAVRDMIVKCAWLRKELFRGVVPRRWQKFIPRLAAVEMKYADLFWRRPVVKEEIEGLLGFVVPPHRQWQLSVLRRVETARLAAGRLLSRQTTR